ncbi:MAG TPA: hypothetical protein VKI62_07015, partial [Bacteroidota bacterium]|nr:hypothetical protein [Bacteroidota bacterium]
MNHNKKNIFWQLLWGLVWLLSALTVNAEERTIIHLRDFSQTEVKSGGFTLSQAMPVHITARGGGESSLPFS